MHASYFKSSLRFHLKVVALKPSLQRLNAAKPNVCLRRTSGRLELGRASSLSPRSQKLRCGVNTSSASACYLDIRGTRDVGTCTNESVGVSTRQTSARRSQPTAAATCHCVSHRSSLLIRANSQVGLQQMRGLSSEQCAVSDGDERRTRNTCSQGSLYPREAAYIVGTTPALEARATPKAFSWWCEVKQGTALLKPHPRDARIV